MSKGAEACGVSQSAATQHVKEVERRLRTTLFDRTKRPLELTEAGQIYAEFAREVLRLEEHMERAIEALEGGGTVRVASIYSIGLTEMNRLQERFTADHPQAHLQVEYMRPDRIYESVRNDSADLGLVSYPEASREIAAIPWREEEMQLAVPPSHPFAARTEVEPWELTGQDFIAFDEDLTIRHDLDRFFRGQSVEVRVVMHFDNIQTIKEAVALGNGIAILPARTMQQEIEQSRLVAVRLNAPGLVRPIGVVHRKRKTLTRAARAFLELLDTPELPTAAD
jgi:DNA-binding transcriptional LysR family regulator